MNGARTLLAYVALAICVRLVVGCKPKVDEPIVVEPIVAEPGIFPRIVMVSIGDSFTLSGENVPSGATWLSKDDSTAFVDPSGRVAALSAGAVQTQVVKDEEVLATGYAVITGEDTGVNYLDTLELDETGRPSQRTRQFMGPSPTGVNTEIVTYQWSPSSEFLVANENNMLLQDETRKTWRTEDKRDEAGRLESRHVEHLLGDKVTERSWDNYEYDDKGRITAIHGEGTLGKDGKPAKWWKEWEYDAQGRVTALHERHLLNIGESNETDNKWWKTWEYKEGKISKFHKTHDILFPDGKETRGWWTTYGKIHDSITHDEDGTKTSSWDWHWPDTEPPKPEKPPKPDKVEPVRPLINVRDITHRDEQEQITGGLRFNYSYDIDSNMVNVRRTALTKVTVPEVLDVSPVEGPVGQRVEIRGRNLLGFSGIASVTFNGITAEIITASKELLLVEVPAGATDGPMGIRTDSGTDGLASHFCIPQC